MSRSQEPHVGTANVFADLNLPDAETHFLKAQIVAEIHRLATAGGLSDAESGRVMGLPPNDVSSLFRGAFRDQTVERLIGYLTRFEQDVEIVVRPHAKRGEAGAVTFKTAVT